MNDDLVTIAVLPNATEAALARNLLDSAGIKVLLADEESVAMAWHLGNAIGGIKLQVTARDADLAQRILADQLHPEPDYGDEEPETGVASAETLDRLAQEAAEEIESPLSPREKDAERAVRCAVAGLLIWPLQLYTVWLLLKVYFSNDKLEGKPKRRVVILGLVFLAIPVLIVVLLMLPPDFFYNDPLLELDHPPKMVGFWSGTYTAPDQKDALELDLRANGKMLYWQTGRENFEATGSWGYAKNQFQYQFLRMRSGDGPPTKTFYFFYVRHMAEDKLVLGYEQMQIDLKKR